MAIGPTTVSTTTDGNGNYVLNVPGGDPTTPVMYAVCEVVQTGWKQASPTFPAPCASGMGYDFGVVAGGTSEFVSFSNLPL
jgi:hypothetical protein